MSAPHTIDREEVMAYLDGELSPSQMTIVGQHLETCERCRALAADLRSVSARLGEWQIAPPPAVLDVTVRAALEAAPLVSGSPASERRSRWQMFVWLPVVRVAGMTAVAASVIVAGWMILRPTVPEPAPPAATTMTPTPEQIAQLESSAARKGPEGAAPVAAGQRGAAPAESRAEPVKGKPATPRLDAVEEVTVSQRPQRGAPPVFPGAPGVAPNTIPPVGAAALPPPPPPPAIPPPPAAATAAPPPTTQTAVTAARDATAGGAGAGGRGGAARQVSEVMIDSRNALNALTFLPGVTNRPMIARRAEITIVTTRFDASRADLDRLIAKSDAILVAAKTSDPSQPRAIDALIRIPVEQFDRAIASIRAFGRATRDTQASDDLESASAAVASKWAAAQREEAALQDQLVRQRSDRQATVATEQALTRARENRERFESEWRFLYRRVSHVEVTLRLEESN
jgi:anti-sigma factor RsiW